MTMGTGRTKNLSHPVATAFFFVHSVNKRRTELPLNQIEFATMLICEAQIFRFVVFIRSFNDANMHVKNSQLKRKTI